MNGPEILQQAIQLIQSGHRESGRHLLAQVLRTDPCNIQAWLWMSGVVDTDLQRRDCLRRVLALDPENAAARAGLAGLTARGTRTRPPTQLDPQPRQVEPAQLQQEIPHRAVSAPSEPTVSGIEVDPLPSMGRERVPRAREGRRPSILDDAERREGYRNIMLAGAMVLSMLCGLALLFITVTTIVPRARERMKPTPEPVLYAATLWCPPCEQAGSLVVLWEKVGDGISRGGKVGELPHNTTVSVLAEEWSEPEGRTYLKVAAQGQKGWVPETFIKEWESSG